MSRLTSRSTIWLGFAFLASAVPVAGQQTRPNALLVGKLIYVDHMPAGLDQWIIEDLRVWGRYKRTANPEGVDLVVQAHVPERETEYDMRGGLPRPREKKGKPGGADECPRLKPSDPRPVTISVVDWVTNERLWYVHLIDKRPKKEDLEQPSGPHNDIFTRGMTPDQIAMKITTRLREYVTELERSGTSKQ